MTYINLTPHPVAIYGPDAKWNDTAQQVYQPSGKVARVATIDLGGDGHGHTFVEYGHVHDLPAKVPGVWVIVSLVVALAARGRGDLVAPWGEVRNDTGTMVGCRGLQRVV